MGFGPLTSPEPRGSPSGGRGILPQAAPCGCWEDLSQSIEEGDRRRETSWDPPSSNWRQLLWGAGGIPEQDVSGSPSQALGGWLGQDHWESASRFLGGNSQTPLTMAHPSPAWILSMQGIHLRPRNQCPGHFPVMWPWQRWPLAAPDRPLSAACEQGWLGLLVSLLILQTAALFAPGAAFLAFLCFPWRGHHFRWPSRMVLLGARRLPVSRREDAGVR